MHSVKNLMFCKSNCSMAETINKEPRNELDEDEEMERMMCNNRENRERTKWVVADGAK